jgi:hypothetical protein
MALDFTVKDVIHKVTAKFVHAFLPDAKKPYNLRAVFQPELDVHGVASKAAVYNIETDPKVIEEGMNAFCELAYYLTADGYKIKTPLFSTRVRLPGEYEGAETSLPDGIKPELRMQAAAAYRKYINERVRVQFDGIDETDGLIAEALDEKTGHIDDVVTIGNILHIRGYGLKVEADTAHAAQAGIFFQPASGGGAPAIKAEIIAVNEPRTLKLIAPSGLTPGAEYFIQVVTQSSAKHSTTLLKEAREMKSEFKLTAQA